MEFPGSAFLCGDSSFSLAFLPLLSGCPLVGEAVASRRNSGGAPPPLTIYRERGLFLLSLILLLHTFEERSIRHGNCYVTREYARFSRDLYSRQRR